jgi:hypothetical protein
MKKRLEADLISIAHRILKLKNKSEVDSLYKETQKLYETLTVLKFYNDNYEVVKNEISEDDFEEKLESSIIEKEIELPKTEAVIDSLKEESIVSNEDKTELPLEENVVEEANETPIIVGEITLEEEENEELEEDENEEVIAEKQNDFEPLFEMASEINEVENKEEVEQKEEPKSEAKQISFGDLLGENYSEPEFVKPNDVTKITPKTESIVEEKTPEMPVEKLAKKEEISTEKIAPSINIGLNDRVGFVKYLFANSNEDFNRVLSQLNTFDSYKDAKNFINEMVKPDYENWKGQEDYEERFLEFVERKFN